MPKGIKKEIWDTLFKEKKHNTACAEDIDYCDKCNAILKISEDKFSICTNDKCGKIFRSLIKTAEWRFYSGDGCHADPSRSGMPINPLLEQSSYGCTLSNSKTYEMRKIKRYAEWQSMPYKEKAKYDCFEKIKALATNSNIPKIFIDKAMQIHDELADEKTFRGLNRDGIIAASMFISCKLNNFPRTAKELSVIFNLDSTSATKGCKNAMFILNKKEKDKKNEDKSIFNKTEPHHFIDRFCSKLHMGAEEIKIANFICLKIEKNNYIPENTPHAVAAGIIFFISDLCNLDITKQNINTASDISEVTINKCYRRILELEHKIVPPVILRKYRK
jgi:transcription initiation factor TFIIB